MVFLLEAGFPEIVDWNDYEEDEEGSQDSPNLVEERAAQLAENFQYYRYLLYEDEEKSPQDEKIGPEEEALNQEAGDYEQRMENDENEPPEDEDWNDAEYRVRFDMRLGFITDEYDSGYDWPHPRHQVYNDYLETMDEYNQAIDEENQQLEVFLIEQHRQSP